MQVITEFLQQIWAVLAGYRPIQDTLDILLAAVLIYELIKIIRQTRSVQIFKGIAILLIAYFCVILLDMPVMKALFGAFFASSLVIIVILFSPELRNVLERLGRSSISRLLGFNFKQNQANIVSLRTEIVNSVCSACSRMSDEKIGALIVFEKGTMLGEIMHTGTYIDAKISSSLIRNIFYPKSPLHDGAMVISRERAMSVGCILPLTDTRNLDIKFGTRHRAAVGMTENTDAVVIVVSEENGAISFVEKGMIKYDITTGELRDNIINSYINEDLALKKKPARKGRKAKGGEADGK